MLKSALLSLAAGAGIVLSAPLMAQSVPWHSSTAIDRAVAEFTGVSTGQAGGARTAVDRRVRLAQCRGPLALTWRNARRDMVLVECPDLGGWRMFVPVQKESSASQAPTKPQVKRGQAVTIAVRGNGFAVSQPGEAMEAGRVGDWIRVKPFRSKETLKAKIVDPGLVEVTLR